MSVFGEQITIPPFSSRDDDVDSMLHTAKVFRKNVTHESILPESTLREELFQAQIEWPESSHRYFIPADDFERMVTPEAILKELRGICVSDEMLHLTAEYISKSAPKLFAILVCLKHTHLILDFLKESIDDKDLPLIRSDENAKPRGYELYSSRKPKQLIKCTGKWDRELVNAFSRDQWSLLTPIFEYDDEIIHYELHDNCVLPWVEDEQGSSMDGGYGSIWKIAIHPAHQKIRNNSSQMVRPHSSPPLKQASNCSQLMSKFVALKRLHSSTNEETFRSEVAMFKRLKKRQHAHIVNLLATFRLKGRYYLLFPYADFNLRRYWQHTPIPAFSMATVSWFLHQCKVIVSALQEVHIYQSTQRLGTSGSKDEGYRYDRHGDIKAESILFFAEGVADDHGHLVLADFGMTAFHKKTSRSKVKLELVTGSPSYKPPEFMLHSSISRAYDIWCLGCLYLEFISWLLCGWEQLSRFLDAHGEIRATTLELNGDTFFTISQGGRTAIVRQGVQDWIKDLHEMPRCSAFLHEMLSLISEQMLVVNPGDRIQISQLNTQLARMIQKSTTDPLYLIASIPSSPRGQNLTPLSLVALRKNGAFKPPLPTEGMPLPKRSSLVSGIQRTSIPLPQTEAPMFVDTSPPTSPTPERAAMAAFE